MTKEEREDLLYFLGEALYLIERALGVIDETTKEDTNE